MTCVRPVSSVSETQASTRLSGVDAARALALLAVVYLHAPKSGPLSLELDELARFAVPFFFLATGYFLERAKGSDAEIMTRGLWRIGLPFLAWTAVYNLGRRIPLAPLDDAMFLLRGGHGFHLWFLPTLLVCWALLLGLRRGPSWLPLATACVFYVAALIIGSYAKTLFGATPPGGLARSALGGFLFVVLGYTSAARRIAVSIWGAVALLALGAALSLIEGQLLAYGGLEQKDFFIGTIPLGDLEPFFWRCA